MITWFTAKVKSLQIDESGNAQRVTTPYLVDAVSFTDAESQITEQMNLLSVPDDWVIESIIKPQIEDVVEDGTDNPFYKLAITYEDLDTKSQKQKKVKKYFIMQAANLQQSIDFLSEHLDSLLVPYELLKAERTDIAEVFRYQSKTV